jgi:hypothetical protein
MKEMADSNLKVENQLKPNNFLNSHFTTHMRTWLFFFFYLLLFFPNFVM